MSLQWSPADLDRQRQIVGLAVDRAQSNRERLWSARHALAGRLRTAAVPVAVSAAALAAAFALGRYVAPRAAARRYREPVSAPAEQAGSRSTSIQSLVALAMTLTQIYLRVRTLVAPSVGKPPAARAR